MSLVLGQMQVSFTFLKSQQDLIISLPFMREWMLEGLRKIAEDDTPGKW